MYRARIFLLLLFFLSFQEMIGQDLAEAGFTKYTTASGISDNAVNAILQDATGYIWLPTTSGLNRFDGSRFRQYHSTSDSLSPASEHFSGANWLDKDRIAFFSVGLFIVNTRTGETKNLFIPYSDPKYQYKFNMIMAARGDSGHNIYVLSRSGFYHFDSTGHLLFRFDYYTGEKIASEHFVFGSDIIDIGNSRLLIISVGGLYLYEKDKRQLRKMTGTDEPLLAEFLDYPKRSYRFFETGPGKMLVFKSDSDSLLYTDLHQRIKRVAKLPFQRSGTEIAWRSRIAKASDTTWYITAQYSGFFRMRINPSSGEVRLDSQRFFPSYQCQAMMRDRDGNTWIATSAGLFRQDPARSDVRITGIPENIIKTFPGVRINAVEASATKIYVGLRGGGGFLIFDKKSGRFVTQKLFTDNPLESPVYHLQSVDAGNVLLGTGGPLLLYNERADRLKELRPPGWTPEDWTNELFKDSKGNIWISALHIYRYNPATHIFTMLPATHSMPVIPVAIAEDTAGYIWIAGHGITRYNEQKNTFDRQIDSFPFVKMPDKQVSAMIIDRQNNIWFGSANNGLISYNIDKKTFRHFSRGNGLPDDNISSLIIVGPKLWIACYSGIACMDLQTLQIKRFGPDEGMPDMPVMNGSRFYYDTTQRELYIGFHTSLARFNPFEMVGRSEKPSVFLESINIQGRRNIYLPTGTITTSWRNNDLTLTIGSINFYGGQSQAYAYRIFQSEATPWHQLGGQPSFNISNLEPGTYRIQFKVLSLNNSWPDQIREIRIDVLPPFWQKPWFIILLVLALLCLLYLFIRWRTEAARKKEMEKTQVQKLMAEDYKNRFELEQISNYFSSSLADKKTTDEVLWDVAGHLIGRMNYEDCMIYLWNEDKTKMVQKAAYGLKGKPEYISEQLFDVLPGQGVVGYVMETMQPVLIKDTRTDKRYRVDEAFRLSEVCVPIIHDNELLGVIDSEHQQADYFTERDIKILTTIATLIGNKLKQLESEKTLAVKQQELVNINEQLAEAKLSALQAQMNPHFVFNALNSIKRMILEGDNDKASRYLSKFASMIRMTLNHSKETFVTLKENTDYLQTYLQMEQLRFDQSFTCCIDVSEDLDPDETLIPSLMIQPLVENAIWHGLLPSPGEKKLCIDFSRKLDMVICTIEDNGVGFRQSLRMKEENKAVHHSVGLDNLRRRIKILNEKFEASCSIAIKDLEDEQAGKTGTRVTLQFKIINQ